MDPHADDVLGRLAPPPDDTRPYAAGPADLYTFGKVMGGGFPTAAFGGRAEVMSLLAPAGPVYQAGTLSGNPVASAAGLATLRGCTDEVGSRSFADLVRERDRALVDLLRVLGKVPGGRAGGDA